MDWISFVKFWELTEKKSNYETGGNFDNAKSTEDSAPREVTSLLLTEA